MSLETRLCSKAVKHFDKGYNCAQSVLLTMADYWHVNTEAVPEIATGFGGGIGRCGSTCGALAGGVMALGIRFGTREPSAKKRERCYKMSRCLYIRFERQYGSTRCRDLIGYDLSSPEDLKKAREADVFEQKCFGYIQTVVRTLLELTEGSRRPLKVEKG